MAHYLNDIIADFVTKENLCSLILPHPEAVNLTVGDSVKLVYSPKFFISGETAYFTAVVENSQECYLLLKLPATLVKSKDITQIVEVVTLITNNIYLLATGKFKIFKKMVRDPLFVADNIRYLSIILTEWEIYRESKLKTSDEVEVQ